MTCGGCNGSCCLRRESSRYLRIPTSTRGPRTERRDIVSARESTRESRSTRDEKLHEKRKEKRKENREKRNEKREKRKEKRCNGRPQSARGFRQCEPALSLELRVTRFSPHTCILSSAIPKEVVAERRQI